LLVGVDCEPLVAAVLVIRQRLSHESRLSLRAGIASGDVIVLDGDDYVGRAVNVAARLCEVAQPGRVVAWTNHLEIPEWATSTPMEPVRVKGMARYVDAVALEIDETATDTMWTAPARALRSIMALMHPRPRPTAAEPEAELS
jgi:class 3 adenylate cyclase